MAQVIVIVALFALLWLFFIRPQRQRVQAQQALVSAVAVGDEILTAGGIYGTVLEVRGDNELLLEIAPGREFVPPAGPSPRSCRPTTSRSQLVGSRGLPSRITGSVANLVLPLVNRRPHLTLVALIAAALVGVGLIALPGSPLQKEPTLGLDLQGGLEVTLEAVPEKGRPLQKSDLDRSVEILRERVDKLGVAEPEIRKQGDNQIVIDLPGVKNPAQVIEILGKTAQLELYDLEVNLAPPSKGAGGFAVAKESLYELLAGQQALLKSGGSDTWYLFDDKQKLRAGPTSSKEQLLASKVVEDAGAKGKLPKGWKTFGVPPRTVVLTCGVGEVVCPGINAVEPTTNYFYLLRNGTFKGQKVPEMTGADLKLSGTRQDFDPTTGEPIVTMQFTDDGEDKFGDITARRGTAREAAVGVRRPEGDAALRDRPRP